MRTPRNRDRARRRPPQKRRHEVRAACVEALDLRLLLAAQVNAISVNFTGGGNNNSAPVSLSSTSSAGVVPKADYTNAGGGSGTAANLLASNGNPSGASVQWTAQGTYSAEPSGFTPATPDQSLNDGFLFSNGTTPLTVAVTGIPFSTYDVYVYELNDASGRVSQTTDKNTGQSFYGSSPSPGDGAHETGAAGTYQYIAATSTTSTTPTANADYVLFSTQTGSSFTFTEDASGNGYVNGFEIVNHPLAAPSVPVLATPVASPGTVALTWNAVTNGDTYTLYRSGPGAGTATAIATGLVAPSYTDTTVTNGSTYTYYVTAVNSFGTSAASNTEQATPQGPPMIVTAAAANPSPLTGTSATLTVSATDSTGGTDLTYTWTTTGNPPAAVTFSANSTNAASTTTAMFTQTGTYNFLVTVTNPSGTSVTSSVSLAVTDPTAAPAQPAGVTALSGSSGVTVSWLPSAGAATYDIFRATTSGGEGNTPLVSGITATNYTDATAVSGSSYYYEVVAVSSYSISSPRSAEVLAANGVDVLSYHGGTLASQGLNNQETQLTPGDLSTADFGMDFATDITDVPNLDGIPTSTLNTSINYTAPDGQAYGEPLVKTGLSITTGPYSGTIRNVVFVATELGSLFAIDADGGNVLWKDSFIYNAAGNPNPLNPTVPNGTTAIPGGFNTETNSQDVSPWICIMGTPVIDTANNSIYLITNTRYVAGGPAGDQTNPHYLYTIHKINMSNGVDTSSVFADTTLGYSNPNNPTYTYNSGPYVVGTGEGATTVNGQSRVYFNAVRQMVRPALEIYNGRVYMASASHGDNQPYHGWIITFDVNTLAINAVFNTTPNGVEGGIWSGGDGVVFDSQGNFYVMTGNGTFDGNFSTTNGVTTYTGLDTNGFPDLGDYGDAFIKLSLDPTTTATNQNVNGWGIKVDDYFTPQNNQSLDSADEDLGSGGPMLLPAAAGSTAHPNLIIGAGKEGSLYLLDTNNMGKFTYNDAGAVQEIGDAVNGVLSTPSYFNGRIYVSAGYGGDVASWTIANAQINTSSEQESPDSIAFPGSSPSISANGTQNGVVWVIDKGTGELRAYDAENLSDELWTSNLDQARDALPGGSVKFSVATPVNGRVYALSNNDLVAYGPPLPPTAPPAAPSGATAIATGASTISVSWMDNSNNEDGFAIERSVDGTNFTQVATVGVDVTTYVDTGLDPTTEYYYRVRAYNSFDGTSDSAYTNITSATTLSIGSQQPVDLYHFDEDTGTTAKDSIGTNTGTLIGSPLPVWTAPGRVGTSDLTFSGNGQYDQTGESAVHLANDLSPILGGTSSLDAWFKTTQTGNNTHWMAPAITGVEQTGAGNDINWGTLNAAGDIGIFVGDSGGVYSTNPVNDGNWHNIAITRNATTGVVQLYIDGVLNGTGTFDTGNKTSDIQLIGALEVVAMDGVTQTGANYFNGQIDEVAIYNQVLDPAVIASLALPPPAPTNLAVTAASGTELDLTWTSNSPYASGYVVQRQIGNGPWVSLPTLPSGTTSYDDTGLTPDTAYSYQVEAIDSAGASAFSNVVTMTTPVPPAHPSNAAASDITTNQIFLTWTNNATNATGYRILQSTIGGEFVAITPPNGLPATATSYLDTGLAPGTEYDYHIQCYNIAGVSDFTGVHTGTLAMPPSPVTASSIGGDSIMLSWTPPAYNGDAQDLTYNIYRGTTAGGEAATPIATNVSAPSYVDTGLVAGQQYYYQVTAVDLGGESVPSAEVSAIPGSLPAGVTASSGAAYTYNSAGNALSLTSGTLTFNNAGTASSLTLNVTADGTGSNLVFDTTTYLNSLTLTDGATAQLAQSGTDTVTGTGSSADLTDFGTTLTQANTKVLELNSLSIPAAGTTLTGGGTNSAQGTLDLTNNAMILNYAPGSSATALAAADTLTGSGSDGGVWDGTGITSSNAEADNNNNGYTAIGVADNGSLGYNTFAGQNVSSGTQILFMYTYNGDADLNGVMNVTDTISYEGGLKSHPGGPAGTGWEYAELDYGATPQGSLSDLQLLEAGFRGYKANGAININES